MTPLPPPRRVLMLGATGTIGRATVAALLHRGHEVVCLIRPQPDHRPALPPAAILRHGDATDAATLATVMAGGRFDAVLSCLASRTGTAQSAWAIDHRAHSDALLAAQRAGIGQMVLLSAICVQKPLLPFQQAKRAFERELEQSGLTYSIVRPTAFFKSLSGQVDRLKRGKPFLLFGDGESTACKPISDGDLAGYLADCLTLDSRHNRILPIGGPGPAITPCQQGEALFRLLRLPPRFRSVPLGLLDGIVATLGLLGHASPRLRAAAEMARIGRYYATESMLVLDPATGRYDADATPSTGTETLVAHYARLIRGEVADDRGEHAVF